MFQDLRLGIRTLAKAPGFTAVVVLTLALGIGANIALFSIVNGVLLNRLPFPQPDQLVTLDQSKPNFENGALTYPNFCDLQKENRTFASMALSRGFTFSLIGAGEAERVSARLVTADFFTVFDVKPALGRTFASGEDEPGVGPVVVISADLWDRKFGSAKDVLSKSLTLDDKSYAIVGVMPARFPLFRGTDVFVPIGQWNSPALKSRTAGLGLHGFGRLKPGVSIAQAQTDLSGVMNKLATIYPGSNRGNDAKISSLKERMIGGAGPTLWLLLGAVGFVLLIACANIAGLLLARAAARQREMAVRAALGAGRWRLVRQLLVECTLLAIAGGAFGCLLAQLATRSMVAYMSAGRSALILDLHFSVRVLLFTAAVSILTGLLFGIAPALRATHIDLTPALKNRTETSGGRSSLRAGKVLAVAQIALSLLLLAGAGLFVRSLVNLNRQDEGFNRDKVLIVRVEPKLSNQRNERGVPARLDRIYTDLLQRIRAIPEVQSASLANVSPTKPESGASAGSLQARSGERVAVSAQVVYPKYFETMGIPVFDGRDFNDQDLTESSMRVCVVNETFAKLAFPGEDPMGRPCVGRDSTRFGVIVGLVKDSRYTSLNGPTPPVIYQPFLQANTLRGQMILHVRMNDEGKPDFIATRIREEVWKTDKEVPQFEVRSLAQEVNAVLVQQRMIATLSTLFGVLALLLACVGIYGVFAFAAIQRTGEMAIRVALGARRIQVAWVTLREALLLVGIGIAIGVTTILVSGYAASGRVSKLLFGLEVTDLQTIAVATLLLALVAALAAYLPARRASRVDPIAALRHE